MEGSELGSRVPRWVWSESNGGQRRNIASSLTLDTLQGDHNPKSQTPNQKPSLQCHSSSLLLTDTFFTEWIRQRSSTPPPPTQRPTTSQRSGTSRLPTCQTPLPRWASVGLISDTPFRTSALPRPETAPRLALARRRGATPSRRNRLRASSLAMAWYLTQCSTMN